MSVNYVEISGKKRRNTITPQNKPIPGREAEMSKNAAGGYSFTLDSFGRLNRFLILGVEGGTIYQSQKDLVVANAKAAQEAIQADPKRVVDMIVDVIANGRSYKPDAGLFVLAMVASHGIGPNDTPEAQEARSYALSKLSTVARIPTHLYTFANYVKDMRGWGASLRKAFARWYEQADIDRLALHAWKYKSRNGFSHRDLLRLGHPNTTDEVRNVIFRYMTNPKDAIVSLDGPPALAQIAAAEELLHLEGSDKDTVSRAVNLIRDYRLTHEAVPGHLLNEVAVWEALAQDMPVIAMVRNLGKMTSIGFIKPLSDGEKLVVDKLGNAEVIQKSRAHPMQFLIAMKQYEKGHGTRGSLSWNPSSNIVDALDGAFESSFGNVEVSGKRILLAVDDSGSMTWKSTVADGLLTPAYVAAAVAYITLRTEPNAHLIGYSDTYREIPYSRRSTINSILQHIGQGGGTNTALPVHYVTDKGMDVDAIVSYTDNNTWSGRNNYSWGSRGRSGHAAEVLKLYQNKVGHPVRFANVAMESNDHSDADPTNPNAIELVGFDASTPKMIGDFVAGRL